MTRKRSLFKSFSRSSSVKSKATADANILALTRTPSGSSDEPEPKPAPPSETPPSPKSPLSPALRYSDASRAADILELIAACPAVADLVRKQLELTPPDRHSVAGSEVEVLCVSLGEMPEPKPDPEFHSEPAVAEPLEPPEEEAPVLATAREETAPVAEDESVAAMAKEVTTAVGPSDAAPMDPPEPAESPKPSSSPRPDDGSCTVMLGELTKRGSQFPWSWRRRTFHYDRASRAVYYYDYQLPHFKSLLQGRDMWQLGHTLALGRVVVRAVVPDGMYDAKGRGLLFVGEDGRLLHAVADSAEERERWVSSLAGAAEAGGEN